MYQDMSVRRLYKPGIESKLSKDETSSLNNGLDNLIKDGYIGSDITNNPSKTKQSLESVTNLLNEFYKNPDKFNNLKNYLSINGLYLREPSQVGVFDNNPDAVARTDTQNVIEVNFNFDKLVKNMMNQYSLRKDEAEELILTHELVHMAQPNKILNANPKPYIAELHVELVLKDYFTNKSLNSTNKKESEKYQKMARAVESRALNYVRLLNENKTLQNYISMN